MRIAVSGSQRVGKSTLVDGLSAALPHYRSVDEPYHLLEEDGYAFGWPPTAEDFEAQLDRSVAEIMVASGDVLFERCPADLLAYLLVQGGDVEPVLERCHTAMELLDLVVYLPIEQPDRIPVGPDEDREQRRAVDAALERLLLDELAAEVLVVEGESPARLAHVLNRIPSGDAH